MPLIVIALALTLFLGGSAAVTQTPEGHAAASHVAHAWTMFEAKLTGNASATADATAQDSTDATSTTQVQGAMRIRPGVNVTGGASTNVQTQGPALNADGSVKVNVF